MNLPYRALIFDWDGTLADSLGFIVQCVQRAAADIDLPVPEAAKIRQFIGLGGETFFQQLFQLENTALQNACIEAYRRHFFSAPPEHTQLFPEVIELLTQFQAQGYWLAVATGKSRRGLEKDLGATGLQEHFLTTRCADETRSKPHPQMLLEILDELALTADEVLMIGDSEYDIQLAHNAGCKAIAVSQGAHSREHLETFSPLTCLEQISGLSNWLSQQQR